MKKFFLFINFFLVSFCFFAYAAEKDYKKILLEKKKELSEVNQKIEEEKKAIAEAKISAKETAANIQKLDKAIDIARKELSVYENNITAINAAIKEIEQRIAAGEKSAAESESRIKKLIRENYKKKGDIILSFVLRGGGTSGIINRYKMVKTVGKRNISEIEKYRQTVERLKEDRESLVDYKQELELLKKKKAEQQKIFLNEKWKKHAALNAIKSSIDKKNRLIQDLEKSSQKLAAMLRKTEAEAELSERNAQAAFVSGKGTLPWPVNSRNVIVKFGKYRHPEFKTIVINRGLLIKTPYAEPVYSVFRGKVKYADWFEGYGKLIILFHGAGYYTIYGHLSDIDVKENTLVESGQQIGKTGDTESFYGSVLYFEMRKKSEPVDPLRFLKK